jgi:hypothetical protein
VKNARWLFHKEVQPAPGLKRLSLQGRHKAECDSARSAAVATSARPTAVAGCAESAGAPPAGDPGAPATASHINAIDDTCKDQRLTNGFECSN